MNPFSSPVVTVFVPVPGGPSSIPVSDGTYYIASLMVRDSVFGEPRPEDVLSWYNADANGDLDGVTVSGGAGSGVDLDLGFVYVDIDATGGNNGGSWEDAFTDLQDGIDLAVSGIDVWVAEGTYFPGTSRSASFLPKRGVRVFGGFTGIETLRTQRDWNAHPTILSCEIGDPPAMTPSIWAPTKPSTRQSSSSRVLRVVVPEIGATSSGDGRGRGGEVRR